MVNYAIFVTHVVTALNLNLITESVHQDAQKCQYCNLIYLKFQRIILILLVIRQLELCKPRLPIDYDVTVMPEPLILISWPMIRWEADNTITGLVPCLSSSRLDQTETGRK